MAKIKKVLKKANEILTNLGAGASYALKH